jgi:two-component system OmpR family response regulator
MRPARRLKWGIPVPTLLLVEDDRSLGAALISLFSSEGYDVQYAEDGLFALAQVQECTPDVVVTDAMMPRLDGLQLIKLLREQGVRVPVILISANNVDPRQPGVRFLAKPFDVDRLLTVIHEAIMENGAHG